MIGELLTSVEAIEAVDRWDDLAEAAGRPYCRRGWMLAWWAAAAPPAAELSVAVASESGRVAAIAPFYAERRGGLRKLKLLASQVSAPIEPLAESGRERQAAPVLARLLASTRPDLIRFDGLPEDSPWPTLLQRSWPRPTLRRALSWGRVPAPQLSVAGMSYDKWWSGKSASFRRDLKKNRRKLEEAGAVLRCLEGAAAIEDGLRAFWRLHHSRLAAKGGSSLDLGVDEMLRIAARRLAPEGRMWLWTATTKEELISVQICLASATVMSCWNAGFHESWAACQPGVQTLHAAIEDGFRRGITTVDLGPGDAAYKYRFATGERWLKNAAIAMWGARAPVAAVDLARGAVRDRMLASLPEEWKSRLKMALGAARLRARLEPATRAGCRSRSP